MMTSDEEKRWLVVGVAMTKVVAPVLRDVVKQGMDLHYKKLDAYCNHLPGHLRCNLNTLTFSRASRDVTLESLKFENINSNSQTHGKTKKKYNYNVSSPVDLAKLYLPDYLATFSAFDESLDLSAILRLLGWSRASSIYPTLFPSPVPLHPIQSVVDDVRDHIRNKWAHANFSEWSEAFFNDCFTKLEGLVKSVGVGAKEKDTLDQLSDWQTKGCQIVMGHAVDQQLLDLVRQSLKLFCTEFEALQETVKEHEQELNKQALQGEEHQQRLDEMSTQQTEQGKQVGALAQKHEDLERNVDDYQQRLDEQAQQAVKLQQSLQEMSAQQTEEARRVDEALVRLREDNYNRMLELLGSFRVQPWPVKEEREPALLKTKSLLERPFDLKAFRAKLSDRYIRTATVPTSVWSAKSKVDIRKVYTRLSMKKEEQSVPVDYTELFFNTKEGLVPKRILVEGQAGIGKSTFVTKLCLDWAEGGKESVPEESNALKKFELVLSIKLRDVSHCQTLEDVIKCSDLLSEEDKHVTDALCRYTTENQDKVLLIFDGYDEYGKGSDSEVYDVFKTTKLRDCCVLLTSRCSQADDVREFADVQAEVTGFNKEDIKQYLAKQLGETEANELWKHLERQRLTDAAKVPLLALFFSLLWKRGKTEFIAKARTMVFRETVQCILDYGHGKCSSKQYGTVEERKDILVDLGRVALESLLNDDLVFEYGKLAAIKCEPPIVHGFLQITEDAENVRPAERVSFIHKSIQEFLAAWYIVNKCTPGGDLGPLQVQASDLEKCLRFENVFQFICGLSSDAAVMVLDHFSAIKLADPTLDLSKTIILPGTEKQTCYDVTDRQKRFHDLVFAAFAEAQSKEGLLRRCVLCTSGVVLLSEELLENLLQVNVTLEMQSGAIIFGKLKFDFRFSLGKNLRMFLDSLGVALRITKGSEVLHLGDFYIKFLNCGFLCMCDFSAILLLNKDAISFYITDLVVACPFHESLFIGAPVDPNPCYYSIAETINNDQKYRQGLRLEHLVPFSFPFEGRGDTGSPVTKQNLLPVESCLKYLQSIECVGTFSREILHELGVIAAKSKYLNCIALQVQCDVYHFLERVKERNNRYLRLSIRYSHTCTPAGLKQLIGLLPQFKNVLTLSLNLKHCTDVAVSRLVDVITHSSLKVLCLKEVNLTGNAAIALGRSVCRMSALEILTINGKNNSLCSPQMKALFDGFSRELPLRELRLSCFDVKNGLSFLRGSFRFFPRLQVLHLNNLGMVAKDVCYLMKEMRFPELHQLHFSENPLGHGLSSLGTHIARLPSLIQLGLYNTGCSPEEVKCINEVVKKAGPMFNVSPFKALEVSR